MEKISLNSDILDVDTSCTQLPDSINSAQSDDNVSNFEDGEVEEEIIQTEPIFDVIFKEQREFNKLRHVVLKALESALPAESQNESSYTFSVIKENDVELGIRVSSVLPIVPENVTANREGSPDFGEDLNALFMIDTQPSKTLNTEKVPSYKRAIKDALDNGTSKRNKITQENICPRPRQALSCFNCGKVDHSMRDCQKPRNMKNINRAKKAFVSKQDRYHIDVEQRFAHLRPGTISSKLQAALGMRRGELPFFFYRMRLLGYPPGWLEDAKVAHSGISLFSSEGTAVSNPCNKEDDDTSNSCMYKYDISKIIDFPGFNQDPGANFYDDNNHHNVPPINPQQMKDEFIKKLGENNIIRGYMRKKLKTVQIVSKEEKDALENSIEVTDMEIEEADPKETIDQPSSNDQNLAKPHSPQLCEASSPASGPLKERCQSPTLEDLEAQQQLLLYELQSSTSHNNRPDDLSVDVAVIENTLPNTKEIPLNVPHTPKNPLSQGGPVNVDIIKESHMGTPLLKFSPFEKLPCGENFRVGVSDVINFENLPDSTGKYEQMKRTIQKVRNIISKLNSEDN